MRHIVSTRRSPTQAAGLVGLIERLDLERSPFSLDRLGQIVTDADIAAEEVVPFLRVRGADCDDSATVAVRDAYEIRCVRWPPGRRTPVHAHGASVCCVRVLQGRLINTEYVRRFPVLWQPVRRTRLSAGSSLACGGGEAHRMIAPDSQDGEALSLHVYSPPLASRGERTR